MTKTAREVIHDWGLDEEAFEKTDDLIAELAAAGFVIVPKEPTAAMLQAGGYYDADIVYRAMVKAAETQ